MEKNILKAAFVLTLMLAGLLSPAQAQELTPTKNYWVVETNLKQRDFSIVRFYNAADELIYEETLAGVYLNISRRKHVKRLNLALARVTQNTMVSNQPDKAIPKNLISGLYRR